MRGMIAILGALLTSVSCISIDKLRRHDCITLLCLQSRSSRRPSCSYDFGRSLSSLLYDIWNGACFGGSGLNWIHFGLVLSCVTWNDLLVTEPFPWISFFLECFYLLGHCYRNPLSSVSITCECSLLPGISPFMARFTYTAVVAAVLLFELRSKWTVVWIYLQEAGAVYCMAFKVQSGLRDSDCSLRNCQYYQY